MSSYHRCSHCKGFYETDLPCCKYCKYTAKVAGVDGSPRVFEDRAACRVIQVAEYERLPPEAMEDFMRPPSDELDVVCGCLHCVPGAPTFEAVEMRWIVNEKMWACPCTTCGGRGFTFDIHPVSARWECVECGKKWSPPEGNAKPSNCKCPVCGCTQANGWFDDEYSEEEIEAMTEEQYAEVFGMTRAEEEAEQKKFNEEFDAKQKEKEKARAEGRFPPEDEIEEPDPETMFLPVDGRDEDEEDDESDAEGIAAYDPEARLGEDDAEEQGGEPPGRDDIDFPFIPTDRPDKPGASAGGDDDIPY